LQGVLQRLASATQPFDFRSRCDDPEVAQHVAESTVNTGTHEQLLRAAVAAIVRPSSRLVCPLPLGRTLYLVLCLFLWLMLERLVLSCLALPCLALPCLVLSCLVLFCLGIGIGIGLSLRGMSSELQTHAKLMHVSHECSDFVQSERNVDMSNLQRAPSYQQYCYVATAHLMSRNFVCCFSTMTNGCIQCPTVQCRPACSVLPVCSLPVGYTLCFFADDRHGQDFSWLEASDQHLTFFRKSGRHTAPINSQTSNCTTISVQRVVSGFAPSRMSHVM